MRVRLVVLGAVLAFGGCAQGAPPSNAPAVPVFSTAPANVGAERTVPDDCGDVATLDELTRDLNNLVTGTVQPVIGVPQDNIGRTARIDCYYGVPSRQPLAKAKVWVGLASYVNEQAARKRLTTTIAEEREAGATVSDVKVGADRGVLIRDDNWMLVAGRGRVTVVVQVIPVLVREDHAGMLLGQVADHALTPR
ncbi:hypothetical protein [Actinophytocola sp. NPDC049390]|uniref:hypothetical protein n=1 Tax=Actinophytocola sp. NPDC049390 TaxID=3363894 RepID=UPI0037B0C13B